MLPTQEDQVQSVEAVRGEAQEDAEVESAEEGVQHSVGQRVTSVRARVVTHL
ncbi:Hypothetical protein A7982_09757 [Minicystis rosea]|nr:Hypothetical protein A7982_09757 [Minicystis rosea]